MDHESPANAAMTRKVASSDTFRLPGHTAILVDNPELPGPIEYIYALYVNRTSDEEPQFIVTAEKQFSMPGIEHVVKDSDRFSEVDIGDVTDRVVIGIQSEQGHENYAASPEYADREKFVAKALLLARERLGVATAGDPSKGSDV